LRSTWVEVGHGGLADFDIAVKWPIRLMMGVLVIGAALACLVGLVIEVLITRSPKDASALGVLAIASGFTSLTCLAAGIYFIPRMRLRRAEGSHALERQPDVGDPG
jgi:Na+-transporting methylmalonyl-CoA/oxaloacetate decarboxylase beta subunit